MFIPDPDFFPIPDPDPGSMGKKNTGSRIRARNTAASKWQRVGAFDEIFCLSYMND
jgi:hypothetical protein